MSFTLFHALQIFKLTMKLTIQPASVEALAYGGGRPLRHGQTLKIKKCKNSIV